MEVLVYFVLVFELEYVFRFVDARMEDFMDDILSSEYVPTKTRTTYLR